jgi:hypothetical protein
LLSVGGFGLGDVVGDAVEKLLRGLDEVAFGVFGEVATLEDDAGVLGEEETLEPSSGSGGRGFSRHGRPFYTKCDHLFGSVRFGRALYSRRR